MDAPDKSVKVSADVSGGLGVAPPSSRTLTIADGEGAPTVTLGLSPPSIGENGGSASVTASLSGPSSQDVTLIVSASPVSPAVSGDFAVSPDNTLTIAAGQTSRTEAVTITGVDNGVDAPDKSVKVSAAVRGGHGVSAPSSRTLTITDDDGATTVVLNLSPPSIGENGGSSRITASLSAPSYAETTVTVSAAPGAGADPGDYSLSGTMLTIAPWATTSAAALTLSAIDNAVDASDKDGPRVRQRLERDGRNGPRGRCADDHRRRCPAHGGPLASARPPSARTAGLPASPRLSVALLRRRCASSSPRPRRRPL